MITFRPIMVRDHGAESPHICNFSAAGTCTVVSRLSLDKMLSVD